MRKWISVTTVVNVKSEVDLGDEVCQMFAEGAVRDAIMKSLASNEEGKSLQLMDSDKIRINYILTSAHWTGEPVMDKDVNP